MVVGDVNETALRISPTQGGALTMFKIALTPCTKVVPSGAQTDQDTSVTPAT